MLVGGAPKGVIEYFIDRPGVVGKFTVDQRVEVLTAPSS